MEAREEGQGLTTDAWAGVTLARARITPHELEDVIWNITSAHETGDCPCRLHHRAPERFTRIVVG